MIWENQKLTAMTQSNPELQLARDFICYTSHNVFLTGKAGTGKTTFLKSLKQLSPKRMVVVAPTGVAAINAGGVTIHSFFQLNFGPQVPDDHLYSGTDGSKSSGFWGKRFSKNKINLIRSLDLLVIDEISMVRADILDAVDRVLRRFRNRYKPFGGVQLLMIGDLQQLAPVAKEEEWRVIEKYYDTVFFFSSKALQKTSLTGIELKHIYRQRDLEFIHLLEKVRTNKLDSAGLQLLNQRYKPGYVPPEEDGYIILTTHNNQAIAINRQRLDKLKAPSKRFKCYVEGEFPEANYPADDTLELKVGAQVMFIRNDAASEGRYYNGKIGKVTAIDDEVIEVICPGENETITVEQNTWENIKYNLNKDTAEIEEKVVGTYTQFPLKLAWAITIHKSQGLTFEKAVIDAHLAFTHGQVYVALSRCKTLEGIILRTPIDESCIMTDHSVDGFNRQIKEKHPDQNQLNHARKEYELQMIQELFDYYPIIMQIDYLMKVLREHQNSVLGNLFSQLQNIRIQIKSEITEVAGKFNGQVKTLYLKHGSLDQNEPLQARLKKAAIYFLEKTNRLINEPLQEAVFSTDNKMIRKQINDSLERLNPEIGKKKRCLEEAIKGFSVSSYLNARALGVIEPSNPKDHKEYASVMVEHPDLYRILLKWRSRKSGECGLPEPRVLQQKILTEIAARIPSSIDELKSIKGMGGKKMKEFGHELLSLIMEYRYNNKLPVPADASEQIEYASLSSSEISLRMFQNGASIHTISQKRNLAISTIESHLLHFVKNGTLEISKVIPPHKYDMIVSLITSGETQPGIEEIKIKLGDKVTYSDIRFTMASFQPVAGE